MNDYYFYMLSSRDNRHLSVRSTADLRHGVHFQRRWVARKLGRKNVYQKLVHVETFDGLSAAVERELEVKSWTATQRRRLVSRHNPRWQPISVSEFLGRRHSSVASYFSLSTR